LFEYKDVFAWSYDDMPGLSTDLVVHKLPTDPTFPPVKQNLRKFKTDMSVMASHSGHPVSHLVSQRCAYTEEGWQDQGVC